LRARSALPQPLGRDGGAAGTARCRGDRDEIADGQISLPDCETLARAPRRRNRKRILLRKCLSPLVDRFVTVSDDLQRWLSRSVGISERKITRIHNGVDVRRFALGRRAAARRLLALDESVFVVGTVGRLDPVKDHATL